MVQRVAGAAAADEGQSPPVAGVGAGSKGVRIGKALVSERWLHAPAAARMHGGILQHKPRPGSGAFMPTFPFSNGNARGVPTWVCAHVQNAGVYVRL